MLFTIGDKISYSRYYLDTRDNPKEFLGLGKHNNFNVKNYSGDIVFDIKVKAESYLKDNQLTEQIILGVCANFTRDTYWNEKLAQNCLCKDKQLIFLD